MLPELFRISTKFHLRTIPDFSKTFEKPEACDVTDLATIA